MKTFKEMRKEITERIKPHDARKSKYYNKQFDRKLEVKKIIKQLDKVGKDVNNLEGRNLDDDDVNYLMGYLSDAEDVAKDYLQTVQKY